MVTLNITTSPLLRNLAVNWILVEPSLTSPLPTHPGLRDHRPVHNNWVLPREQMELCLDSCICGYHVYNEIWTVVLGEVLITERELYNVVDRYAVAMKKYSGETVGQIPRKYQESAASL